MNSKPNNTKRQAGQRTANLVPTRRAVLAAGGAVALSALAGCAALDGLVKRGAGKLVGTTVSAPAAFYPGRPPTAASTSSTSTQERDESQFFRTGLGKVKQVPATVRAEGQEIDFEGWSTSVPTKAQDYNASRSNKPRSEWWAGPDDDSDGDGYGDSLVAIQDVELALLGHVMAAQDAMERRDQAEVTAALDAFINATTKALKRGDRLDRCGDDVCGTVRENLASAEENAQTARKAVDDGDWDTAAAELAAVDEFVLGDIERLDDEFAERRPGRPRFSDIVAYLRDEPTVAERFTVCLPDAKLPGDRGSLAEELTLDRVLAYFAPSHEPDGRQTPFHDRYGGQGISYDDEGCIQLDGAVSLHDDLSCQNILSAELDTYHTKNRAIVGYGTEGGAVVSAAPTTADTVGKRVFLTADVTGEIILGEDRDMVMPGDNKATSGSQTLVCPVTVTPEDCPCPLPGLFYVRRVIHDDQIIFAGGWMLDEGALYEDSVTLLFDEGPTETASVTPEDVESDDLHDRIVEQFSRSRSRYGSMVISGEIDDADSIPDALTAVGGKKGYDHYMAKIRDPDSDGDGLSDGESLHLNVTALDAPLVHLAGAGELSDEEKLEAATGRIETGVINSGEEVDILGMGAEKL